MADSNNFDSPLPAACVRLDDELADFLDGSLDASRSASVAAHLGECARCAAVLESLGAPGDAGLAIAALPMLEAPARVWAGVSARIAAPVVEIGRGGAPTVARRDRRGWWRSGLAAAGLVFATAGVTYTIMERERSPSGAAVVMPASVASASRPSADTQSTPPAGSGALGSGALGSGALAASAGSPGAAVTTVTTVIPVANLTSLDSRRAARALPADPTRDTYDHEIAKLRVVLHQRRGDLDSSTVRVVTQNLKVIDQAIAQSKAALARDPASGFLNKQLNNALDQKLELLRTAALLPART